VGFDDATSHICADPFVTAEGFRAPARRLLGRLTAPVTVWTTSTTAGERVGITTPWGPALDSVATRAGCAVVESSEVGYSRLLRARVEDIVLGEQGSRPLVRFRGDYLTVGARRA
jgi:hypothetical protein